MASDIAFSAGSRAPSPRRKGDVAASGSEHRIYAALLDAIVNRRLPPGAKLPENELAEVFGTNRSRMRRVLGRLAGEGVVVQVMNRGSFVAKPTIEEAREVFAARRMLEASLIREVAEHARPDQLRRLKEHVARERDASRRRHDRANAPSPADFHLLLAESAGNQILEGLLRELVARSSLIFALYEQSTPATCSHDDHASILAALTAGGPSAAAGAMVRHLEEVEGRLRLEAPREPKIDLRSLFARAG